MRHYSHYYYEGYYPTQRQEYSIQTYDNYSYSRSHFDWSIMSGVLLVIGITGLTIWALSYWTDKKEVWLDPMPDPNYKEKKKKRSHMPRWFKFTVYLATAMVLWALAQRFIANIDPIFNWIATKLV